MPATAITASCMVAVSDGVDTWLMEFPAFTKGINELKE